MSDCNIVITGMGAVTPVGIGVENYWKGLLEGKCGIAQIEAFDTENLQVKRAGQVKDFNPKEYLSMRLIQDLEPYMQYAYVSAEEALEMSDLEEKDAEGNGCGCGDRVGVIMGTALCGMNVIGDTFTKLALKNRAAGPKLLTKSMGNIAAAQFAINHKIKGPSMTVSTACSSGGDAITLASMMIKAGAADAMVVMAGEAALNPPIIQSLTKTGALSKTGDSRPFDVERNGFVLGEGGGALILESEEHAAKRGAKAYARLLGCANNTDAFNPVSPDPSGEGAALCMRIALENAGISPDCIDYVNMHGTATHMGDIAESNAIKLIFGDQGEQGTHRVPVSSTKGMTGHMMGAGGVTEVIACIMAVNEGIIPANAGCATLDPECGLNVVLGENLKTEVRAAMSNALGFGGQNSCVIVGKA